MGAKPIHPKHDATRRSAVRTSENSTSTHLAE
jgi:hypothetical protein